MFSKTPPGKSAMPRLLGRGTTKDENKDEHRMIPNSYFRFILFIYRYF
jgi:hypothetical protein